MIEAQRAATLLAYDAETGIFRWRAQAGNMAAGSLAGTATTRGYIHIGLDRKLYRASRLAWLMMTGHWPDGQVDHINRVRSDNSWTNLRLTNGHQNQHNRTVRRDSASGMIGINKPRQRWKAYITLDGKRRHLGSFDCLGHAVQARRAAEKALFQGFRS